MYTMEPQATSRREKISSKKASAVPVLCSQEFPTRGSLFMPLPISPHISIVVVETHNGAVNYPGHQLFATYAASQSVFLFSLINF